MRLTVGELLEVTGGSLVCGSRELTIGAFSNDSRAIAVMADGAGPCFVALSDRRDGHDFVENAFDRGAVAALVTRIPERPTVPEGAALILVDDVLIALSKLARYARQHLGETTVVGITGSSGKTSTKDLLAAAIGIEREVHSNVASFNNEIGLPITLLHAPESAQVIVTEMGARAAGNIADLCAIAMPTIGVVTQVGLAHAEFLGGYAGVLAVKGELVAAVGAEGLVVLNADDPATPALARMTDARVVRVGASSDAEVRFDGVTLDAELRPRFSLSSPWGSGTIDLAVRGEHQVQNASMAATVALSLGVAFADVAAGLAVAQSAVGRMQLKHGPGGLVVLDDCYNANPASTAAALRALAALASTGGGRRIAVLGAMHELGAHSRSEHAEIGRLAARLGLDVVVAVGEQACIGELAGAARDSGDARTVVREVDSVAAALEVLAALGVFERRVDAPDISSSAARSADMVLVKASRAEHFERVVDVLLGADEAGLAQ